MKKPATMPLVSILATGGTVAGKAARPGSVTEYRPGEISPEALLDSVPGLDAVARLRCRRVADIGSEDMTDNVWLALARGIAAEIAREDVAGVVILHGTDTMEETAVFLDLTMDARGKAVVMTGAMRPADALSADGPANILAAVAVAADPSARGRGVLVVMNDCVHRARFVVKTDTLALDAFQSTGLGSEGRVVDGKAWFFRPVDAAEASGAAGAGRLIDVTGATELPRVEIIYGHAGQGRELVDAAVATGAWGVVHAGVGMGNVHRTARAALAEAAGGGMAVVCASRVGGGIVPLTDAMRRDGFVSARDLNPQKARAALRLALTRVSAAREIQAFFDRYAGAAGSV
ncbi:MAG: asparaginase [Planctomycetota bacterium]|jgi:L-asparaginase|nr:asparaginase [Planctomycetota bacterium]